MPALGFRAVRAVAVAVALGMAAPALAHVQRLPVSGKKLVLKTHRGADKQVFSFGVVKDPLVTMVHDPRIEPTRLLVMGDGPNGGRTGLITLDPAKWEGVGTPPGSKGYKYIDPTGSRGGVRKVLMRPGAIMISAKGPNWPWALDGTQQRVSVYFGIEDEWYCAAFTTAEMRKNDDGQLLAAAAPPPASCPLQICGNGTVELGEECDDGNLDDGDGCTTECTIDECGGQTFASTWEAIQQRVFADGGCTNLICHGASPGQGELDLRPENAHAQLVNHPSSPISPLDRVEPGDESLSFLYHKLAAATLPAQYPSVPGSPMPSGLPPLSTDLLEAVRLWIRAGAPATGVVEGTAPLLASCLPPTTPQKIPRPAAPAANDGIQLVQPPYPLAPQSEREICMPTYYDFTGLVPESALFDCGVTVNNPSGKCFRWHRQVLAQDPQSHHSIIRIYTGAYPVTDPGWGRWTYKGGPNAGQSCDPTAVGPNGLNEDCAGDVRNSPGCVFFIGPRDWSAQTSPSFSGSQEPLYQQEFADGVYSTLPLSGVVMWNSHAFNLTGTPTTMEQYLNMYFAAPADQQYPAQAIFDDQSIFVMTVPPFETREYCRTRTLPVNTRLFHISSHMHKRGVLWRTWGPPNATCTPGPSCQPNAGPPIYLSTDYTDPIQLYFDPPMVLTGSAADRTFKYCAKYDNGASDITKVKRFSTSPVTPGIIPGGPCDVSETRCIGGPKHNQLCNGNHAFCDSSPGAGDGDCDACPLRGGVTTEDEMFIWLGTYYVP